MEDQDYLLGVDKEEAQNAGIGRVDPLRTWAVGPSKRLGDPTSHNFMGLAEDPIDVWIQVHANRGTGSVQSEAERGFSFERLNILKSEAGTA